MTAPYMGRRVVVPTAPQATAQVSKFAPASMSLLDASRTATVLQQLLICWLGLFLSAKQAHWNVTGPAFMGVHKDVLDPLASMAEDMADATAERIATLGAAPISMPAAIAASKTIPEYQLLKADTQVHLAAIDRSISALVTELRKSITYFAETDVISQNMLLTQTEALEHMQWFVRAHLEVNGGELPGVSNMPA